MRRATPPQKVVTILLFRRVLLLPCLGSLQTAAPVVWVVFDGGHTKVFQEEIPVGIRQGRAKALGGVSLLADQDPGDFDGFGGIVVVDPGVDHLGADEDLVVDLVVQLPWFSDGACF